MKIEKGQIYKVMIDDCCVTGAFTSRLLNAHMYDDEGQSYPVDAIEYGTTLYFENGVHLEVMGGVQLEKVNE